MTRIDQRSTFGPGLDRGEGATWLRGDGAGVGQPLMSGQRWQGGGKRGTLVRWTAVYLYVPLINWYLIVVNYLSRFRSLSQNMWDTLQNTQSSEAETKRDLDGRQNYPSRRGMYWNLQSAVVGSLFEKMNQAENQPMLPSWQSCFTAGLLWFVFHAAIAVNWEAQAFTLTEMDSMINQETALVNQPLTASQSWVKFWVRSTHYFEGVYQETFRQKPNKSQDSTISSLSHGNHTCSYSSPLVFGQVMLDWMWNLH